MLARLGRGMRGIDRIDPAHTVWSGLSNIPIYTQHVDEPIKPPQFPGTTMLRINDYVPVAQFTPTPPPISPPR